MEVAFAALIVASVAPLYNILKRHFDVENMNLETRRELARELTERCEQWSALLEKTFQQAVDLLEEKGPEAALEEVKRQESDFLALDYQSLASASTALKGLRKDARFAAFARSCRDFYASAINVKRLAHGHFVDSSGQSVSLRREGIKKVAPLWREAVESALENVRREFNEISTLDQR